VKIHRLYWRIDEKMTEEEQDEHKNILILCVDKDCDLGVKANIKTPITGREENLNAAVALALKDPEEPDANAMFEAVRLFDRFQEENNPDETFKIATICGSELGGVGADRKIVAELNELLSSFRATEILLVTDGYTDEAVLPLIESRVPVSSVRRIVIKHSKGIEETAALFTRYLKILTEDPRYSRIALGIPGLLLLILGVFSIFRLLDQFGIAFIIVLGALLLVRGFGIDRLIKNYYHWLRHYSPPPLPVQISNFSVVVGTLCIVVGAYLGVTEIPIPQTPAGWISNFPQITGYFIQGSIDLIVLGICVILLGRSIHFYFEQNIKLLRNAVLIVLVGWSRWVLEATSEILISPVVSYGKLIFYIIIGILIGIASALVILVVYRSSRKFFKGTEQKIEEFEENPQ
jgi:putative membrane protein